MEFVAVREAVSVSDSVLSKHVKQLEEAGYVAVRKATIASRQRTSLSLTRAGRGAFGAPGPGPRRIPGGGGWSQGDKGRVRDRRLLLDWAAVVAGAVAASLLLG